MSFAQNAWISELGRRLYPHRTGAAHADVGARNTAVDVPELPVRRVAFVDVQATSRRPLPQSMVL
jgi:hypothetical protein